MSCNVTAGVQSQPPAVHAQLKTARLAEPALYCLAAHSLVTCTLFLGKWLLLYSGHKQLVTLNVYHILKYWPNQRDFPSPVGRYGGRTRRGRRTKWFTIAVVRTYICTHSPVTVCCASVCVPEPRAPSPTGRDHCTYLHLQSHTSTYTYYLCTCTYTITNAHKHPPPTPP